MQEKNKFGQMVDKYTKDLNELHASLNDEQNYRQHLEMDLASKVREMEALQQQLSLQTSDLANTTASSNNSHDLDLELAMGECAWMNHTKFDSVEIVLLSFVGILLVNYMWKA